jgi:signal transduction histidine kinase
LVSALGYLVDEARTYGVEVTLNVLGSRQRLDPLVETVLFRIAQEALTNVARHAGCGQATIGLEFGPSEVKLSIDDRGVGFNLHKVHQPPHGWGLEGMRERAESVGGEIEIQSTQGAGTHVGVVIPFEEGVYEYNSVNAG